MKFVKIYASQRRYSNDFSDSMTFLLVHFTTTQEIEKSDWQAAMQFMHIYSPQRMGPLHFRHLWAFPKKWPFLCFFSQPNTTTVLWFKVTFDWPSSYNPYSLICDEGDRGVFDGVGSLVVIFYATECLHSHNEYQMKYSIGVGVTFRALLVLLG